MLPFTLAALTVLAAPAAGAEVTGTFLGWSGGTDLAVYAIEVNHVVKRYLRIREETKRPANLRLDPGTRLRFAVVPVGKDRRYAQDMVLDGVLDAILHFEPLPPEWQAVGRAMDELLRSTAEGNCTSAGRRFVKSKSVDNDWQRVCDALPRDPDRFLHQRGDSWAFTSVGPRQCWVILNPTAFLEQPDFGLLWDLTDRGGPRLKELRSLPSGEYDRLFYGE